MKTIGRILIILAVFALVMGAAYVIVNAGGSALPGGTSRFAQGNGRPAPPDGALRNPANGTRPEFPGRERNEFRGGRGGVLFGAIKNITIIAIIVALIVGPKSWIRKRRKPAQAAAG
jgi:hypothetical protein